MELMNRDLSMLTKNFAAKSTSVFKQDPKLVAAIDKLYSKNEVKNLNSKILLPERKLNFLEVQEILYHSTKGKEQGASTFLQEKNKIRKSLIKNVEDVLRKINNSAENGDTPIELFYQNVTRFRNQSNLDEAVRDVCCLLQTPPWNLGIIATAKGLIAGSIKLHMKDGSCIDCFGAGGTLIPQDVEGIKEFRSTAKYILVVEKDAVFQKLLDEGALVRLGPLIILTAQSHLSQSLACSSLQLLGARHGDVMTLATKESRLALTSRDKRKIVNLMKRPYLNTATGSIIRKDLEDMLKSGVKAEIEALSPTAAALCDSYLPSKIIQADYLG
ncbi:unnamed protein product [Parnassius apollo]|uniref:DNA topoisomerase (ATP-hydrolyzing) n=1 Tax=Parnassius apollo TaxID=110799 RepID=A0A8S3Y757_PARAO|nr:unnamed protein product [Parnassius apollo]CAG5056657.1 unnamed protein product [Parnassius apollo]